MFRSRRDRRPRNGEKEDFGAVFRHIARYFLTNSDTTGSSAE